MRSRNNIVNSVRYVLLSLVSLLLSSIASPTAPPEADPTDIIYDLYFRGIKTVELTVGPLEDESTAFTIRRKNWRTNQWGASTSTTGDRIADDDTFELPGALEKLPAHIPAIGRIDWNSHEVVAWPDSTSLYDLNRAINAEIEGETVKATYWALRDASRPMDLVIGKDNRFLAAVDVTRDLVLVRRGFEPFTIVEDWNAASVSPSRHAVRELNGVTMRARDGMRLSTLVYLPEGEGSTGPFPAIFVRTPYGITDLIDRYWSYVSRGYAVVLQATRGRAYWDPSNRSEGDWTPMIDEPSDGADALAWIAKQPWSDGQICMEGGSYVGYTQWTATMAGNPALKCVIPESSMGTAFSDQPYRGGGMLEGMAYYVFWMLNKSILPGRNWTDIVHHRPLVDIDEYATGEDLPEWNTFFEHSTNDAYWEKQNWYRSSEPRRFGALQISGWFDDDVTGTQSNWELMRRTGTRPQRLILGPWRHGSNQDRKLNGFSFGSNAVRDDIWLTKQRWYDHFLRGTDNGVEQPAVDYFLLGSNEWRQASTWPPSEIEPESWYFHSDGQANRLTNRGVLNRSAPIGSEPPDEYRYDPAHAPTNWMSFDLLESWGDYQRYPYDFKDIETRPDVVTFTSTPLDADVTIAGFIEIELYASADVLDTDWWVHLADVYPDDRSIRMTTGMLRARFRNLEDPIHQAFGSNFEREEFLSGALEDVVRYRFSIPAMANTFKKGHRIRIAVMNALDNYYFPNSNTGGDEGTATRTVIGTMRIHHSADYPSHVSLPTLPH